MPLHATDASALGVPFEEASTVGEGAAPVGPADAELLLWPSTNMHKHSIRIVCFRMAHEVVSSSADHSMSSVCGRLDDCSLIHMVFVSCLLADSLIVHGNRSLIGFMITHRSSTEKNNGRQATSLLRCGQPSRTETACNDCVVRKERTKTVHAAPTQK